MQKAELFCYQGSILPQPPQRAHPGMDSTGASFPGTPVTTAFTAPAPSSVRWVPPRQRAPVAGEGPCTDETPVLISSGMLQRGRAKECPGDVGKNS